MKYSAPFVASVLLVWSILAPIQPRGLAELPGSPAGETREEDWTEVNVSTAKEMINTVPSLFILDVQTYGGYISGHMRNARSIPLSELEERLDEVPRDRGILVYGEGAYEAVHASENLTEEGLGPVYAMCCGIRGWEAARYPVFVQYPSLRAAIENTGSGDTLRLSVGTYRGPVEIADRITLIGENSSGTVIDGKGGAECLKITADGTVVTDMAFRNADRGVELSEVRDVRVDNSTFWDLKAGVAVRSSVDVVLRGNAMRDTGLSLEGGSPEHWNSHVMENNRVNEGRLLYLKNSAGPEIRDHRGQIVLANCTDASISGSTLKNTTHGLILGFSNNISAVNNTFHSNREHGIYLYRSSNISITDNSIDSNGGAGLYVGESSGNGIASNLIKDNGGYGIEILSGEGNGISANSFFRNNEGGVQGRDGGSENLWSNISGNYWSDYELRYPSASDNGTVWDTPYALDGSAEARDERPLVRPPTVLPGHPLADAGADLTVEQHDTVLFNATASYGDPPVSNYTWSFGYDGTEVVLYGPAPSFVFRLAGRFEVLLTVTDELGNAATDDLVVLVVDTEPPNTRAGEDIVADQYETVVLDGGATRDNAGVVNYTWSFEYRGDRVRRYGIRVRYSFADAGRYTVKLVAADKEGNRGTDLLNVTIRDSTPPGADAGADAEIPQGEKFAFDASSSRDNVAVVNYTWRFEVRGSDVSLYGTSPSYVFYEAGEYAVELSVKDSTGNVGTDVVNLTVRDALPPAADPGSSVRTTTGVPVVLDGGKSSDNTGVVNYSWSFSHAGKDLTFHGRRMNFTFDEAGNYTVTLTVRDSEGNEDSDSVWVLVEDEGRAPGTSYTTTYVLAAVFVLLLVILIALLGTSGRGGGGKSGGSSGGKGGGKSGGKG